MAAYLAQRLGQSALVVFGISAAVFVLVFLSGDPTALMVPPDATADQVAQFRRAMGFDRPLAEQYLRFLERLTRGNLGVSLRHEQPALDLVLERIPATLHLAAAALATSLLIAVPLGVLSATRRDSLYDHLGRVLALVGQSVPTFWLGIMLILFAAVRWRWFPASGYEGVEYLVLPAVTLGAYSAAVTMRLLRSSLIEVLGRDYIRTARAKGLGGRAILFRHALKNAGIPVVTVLGLQIGTLMGGAMVTETVFAYPGMGLLAIQAVRNRDFPVVQAFVITVGAVIVLANLLVDLAYTYLDPRIRYR
ncbi:MAG: ABC transporter permease [Armatimonadetes bacterium]|nr:ABC transporter permease [Armatimonadota bacterium]